jgi:hypothetical protein
MLTRNFTKLLIKSTNFNFLKVSSFSHNTAKPDFMSQLHSTSRITEFNQNLSPEQKTQMKKFYVHRFDPDHPDMTKQFMSYYVDLNDCGPMILDALIKIKDEVDPTLSFRR